MFKIQTLNKISDKGLRLLSPDKYEYASEVVNPDAIILRSFDMREMALSSSLLAIARAGAGVNNIAIDKCSDKGIVVFNTPGANANAVKELVIMGLFLSSRRVYQGISWVKSLSGKGAGIAELVEKEKGKFIGPEIQGKKLAVIGLGAIGKMVANDAVALGMDVTGIDPYLTPDSCECLSSAVKRTSDLSSLLSQADYITLHVPANKETKGMINSEIFSLMKKGVRIINLARAEIINNKDLKLAIEQGIVASYVTDFPSEELVNLDQVIPIPHLGASTPESEENCAIMAANQLKDYLENGNILNSVNFPKCILETSGKKRITVANKNTPTVIGLITKILVEQNVNISKMVNKSKGEYGYNIIETNNNISQETISQISKINGVIKVRIF